MWLGPARVFYAGLLGATAQRSLGGHGVYVSPTGQPLRMRLAGGSWQSGELLVVPAQVPHQVAAEHPLVLNLLVESESVNPALLPSVLRHCGPVDAPAFAQSVREGHACLLAIARREGPAGFPDFDSLFFGAALAPPVLDPRIRTVIARINADPAAPSPAQDCAAAVGLSFSRFLHLFKEETGVTFRAFRAWKRARRLLYHVRQGASLTDIALDTGYPDSTHFSHSIRQIYGLRPSDILAGSRRLAVHQ
ncbi:AraC family transcriptional regulator [Variovorax sp. JS1663]|uniref:AraC family transcriptional regulator n=1 Tax=Variovorax sp. JS1663 TaxID=1851577 RepID=UPI000B346A79|nr:AraC family transcriptional regulator [Variovorax sp. JS1663]